MVWYMCANLLPVYAAEVTRIELTGKGKDKQIEMQTSETFPLGGLFANFEEVYPGDVRTQEIVLANQSDAKASFYLVMKEAEQEGTEATLDLIQTLIYDGLLQLKLVNGSTVLYEDVFSQKLSDAIEIGALKPGHEADLQLILTVDPAMDNRYQDLTAKVDWVIEARWEESADGNGPGHDNKPDDGDKPNNGDKPNDGDKPNGGGNKPGNKPEEDLDKGDGGAEDSGDIPQDDPEVPNAGPDGSQPEEVLPDLTEQPGLDLPEQRPLPQTGDDFPVLGIVAVGLLAGVLLLVVMRSGKKGMSKK